MKVAKVRKEKWAGKEQHVTETVENSFTQEHVSENFESNKERITAKYRIRNTATIGRIDHTRSKSKHIVTQTCCHKKILSVIWIHLLLASLYVNQYHML